MLRQWETCVCVNSGGGCRVSFRFFISFNSIIYEIYPFLNSWLVPFYASLSYVKHWKENSQHDTVINTQSFIPVIVTRLPHHHMLRFHSCSIHRHRYSNRLTHHSRHASVRSPHRRWQLINLSTTQSHRHHHSQNIGSLEKKRDVKVLTRF